MIEGTGPRYCPSIEDKVVRFADKKRHQVFIEPEGLYTNEMYIGGMSAPLPEDVQYEMYHSVPGLENARIVKMLTLLSMTASIRASSIPHWNSKRSRAFSAADSLTEAPDMRKQPLRAS